VSLRRPGHLARSVVTLDPPSLPWAVPGLDIERAGANVRAAGGDPVAFLGLVGAAWARTAEDRRFDVEAWTALAGIAAWRAGVISLREDALGRIDRLRQHPEWRSAAAGALGLPDTDLDLFADRQRTDRYWWPGRAAMGGYVCAFGGFAGLGGLWTAPPTRWLALPDPGGFAVRTGDEWWRADIDVWGTRVRRLAAEPASAASPADAGIVLLPDTYLAWLHVPEHDGPEHDGPEHP
jgi:hypothetical protein